MSTIPRTVTFSGFAQAAAAIPRVDYQREVGPESVELVMWLLKHGAPSDTVTQGHRHGHVPAANTAVGHVVLEIK